MGVVVATLALVWPWYRETGNQRWVRNMMALGWIPMPRCRICGEVHGFVNYRGTMWCFDGGVKHVK